MRPDAWSGKVLALTITLGAFLLFFIQPLIARILLPGFGGAAAVWIVCLLWFQSALLAGYVYAHVLTRHLGVRRQILVHAALAGVAVAFALLEPGSTHLGPLNPTLDLLLLLTLRVGLAFVVLAGTSPLVQHWYGLERENAYRLYALSNLGSLAALLLYPTLFEPFSNLADQYAGWVFSLVLYLACCLVLARLVSDAPAAREPAERAPGKARLLWLGLSACGTMILLTVSNALSRAIAPFPLIWVLPLALYLVSFILAFDHPRWYRPRLLAAFWLLALGGVILHYSRAFALATGIYLGLYLLLLFTSCLICHGELARRRPEHSDLTRFYLHVAAGGALGGVCVTLLAPVLFADYYEFELAVVLCLAFGGYMLARGTRRFKRVVTGIWLTGLVALAAYFISHHLDLRAREIVSKRSFYARNRVVEQFPGTHQANVTLYSDAVAHGAQLVRDPRVPTTYYGTRSGIGIAFNQYPGRRRKVGVVGLGAGTLAAYGEPGDLFRFYEIDPVVIDLARTHFTYMSASPAQIEVIPGDARVSLRRELPRALHTFDLLVIDAFSGDAIPQHLATREAWDLYWRLLKPDGILAIHATNAYTDITPVVVSNNAAVGQRTLLQVVSPRDFDFSIHEANWLIVTSNQRFLRQQIVRDYTERLDGASPSVTWTDERASILPILRPLF